MQFFFFNLVLLTLSSVLVKASTTQVGIKKRSTPCLNKAKKGDKISVHYTGKLSNGDVFDSSLTRKQPFTFTLGAGQVIKGWDKGLLGMCIGEQRILKIPPHEGYGKHGSPPKIPGDSSLVFQIELMSINDNKIDEDEL